MGRLPNSFGVLPVAVPSVGGDPVPRRAPPGRHPLTSTPCAQRSTPTPSPSSSALPTTRPAPALTYEEIAGFVADIPDDVMIIVDEAYIDFATKPGDAPRYHRGIPQRHRHARSQGSCPGRRARWLPPSAIPGAIGAIRPLLVPFGVNSLAGRCPHASLKDAEGVQRAGRRDHRQRERIIPALRDLGYGIPVRNRTSTDPWRCLRPRRGMRASASSCAFRVECASRSARAEQNDRFLAVAARSARTARSAREAVRR